MPTLIIGSHYDLEIIALWGGWWFASALADHSRLAFIVEGVRRCWLVVSG
ncbi:MAG: hypothetical protein ACHBN1_18060 [Heteroscytonema crispum UTEX LB 1556]